MFSLRSWWDRFWAWHLCRSIFPGSLLAYVSEVAGLVAVATRLPMGRAFLRRMRGITTVVAGLAAGSCMSARRFNSSSYIML